MYIWQFVGLRHVSDDVKITERRPQATPVALLISSLLSYIYIYVYLSLYIYIHTPIYMCVYIYIIKRCPHATPCPGNPSGSA